ncbi:Serine incorporator 1 [Picochlorum sp. SENEW3]|nr:Serine incorporator 1 [Picochlorum sp. SENEW3]
MLYITYDDSPQCFGRAWWWFNVPKRVAPWIYFALFSALAIVSYVVRDYSSQGALAVLRISMGNVLFFSLMTLICLGVSREDDDHYYGLNFDRRVFHTGMWPYKLGIWALLVGTAFLYPENVFIVYQYIAWALAILFVVAQTVIFIDFVYGVNEYMLEKDSCVWNALLVAITALFIAVALGGLLALYYFFVPESSCSMNIAFITSTIGLFLVYSLLSISDIRPDYAGLLASSIVFALCAFYTWGALNSAMLVGAQSKPWECTPLASKDWINSKSPDGGPEAIKLQRTETTLDLSQKAEKGMLVGGVPIRFYTTPWAFGVCDYYGPPLLKAFCMLLQEDQPSSECTRDDGNEEDTSAAEKALRILSFIVAMISMMIGALNTARSSESFSLNSDSLFFDAKNGAFYSIGFFYTIYVLASAYVPMILIGWDVGTTTSGNEEFTLGKSYAAAWARMAASWFCGLLYCWSLVAHKVLARWRQFE